MQKVKIDTIRHLIPDGCIYKNEDYKDDVLYLQGDQVWIEPVDLDVIFNVDGTDAYYPFILIEGNLQATQIFNEETDGSAGLIVLGNLSAQNVVVGGQEIYVTGDLQVGGLFWGDYNHGGLAVEGEIQAKVFLNTDYGVDFLRFRSRDRLQIQHLLWDETDHNYDDGDRMAELFRAELLRGPEEMDDLDELYSWKDWLNTTTIFEALRSNNALLRDDIVPDEQLKIPSFFSDNSISTTNLLRFAESTFVNAEDGEHSLEYWTDGDMVFKRVFWLTRQPHTTMVYFQQEEEFAVMLYVAQPEQSALGKFLKKETPKLAAAYRILAEGEGEEHWHPLDIAGEGNYASFFRQHWERLLQEFSEMNWLEQHFDKTVSVANMKKILALPRIQALGKRYYDDDYDSALYFRGLQWQFRNEDPKEEDAARISVVKTIGQDDDGEPIFEFLHFDIEEDEDGQPYVSIGTQEGDGYEEDVYDVEITDTAKRLLALEYFELLEKHVYRIAGK